MKTFITILILVVSLHSASSHAQSIDVAGMHIEWKHEKDNVLFTASAPEDGWVAIGFNTQNNIVGSNLIMIGVKDQKAISEEFYVVGIGNPQPVNELESTQQHSNVKGTEKNGKTTVSFSIPTNSIDDKHYNLKKGDEIWLICAFSMEDDFDHHSRMRKHVKITL